MESAQALKRHYLFTEEDEENLLRLKPVMETEKFAVGEEFFRYITAHEETAAILAASPEAAKRHRAAFGLWFQDLFKGSYDQGYFLNLRRIGTTHVKIGLSGHFVNAAMNTLRSLCHTALAKHFSDSREIMALEDTLDKILDMNLDVMTSSYREAELRKVFFSYRFDEFILRFAERFSFALKLILVLALMGISLAVVGLFVGDVIVLFREKSATGVLGALGSLLIIWVMVELMENEIRQLRGGKFRMQVFIGVAMVALIREMLIASLQHGSTEKQAFVMGSILSLGIVYWLTSRANPFGGRGGSG